MTQVLRLGDLAAAALGPKVELLSRSDGREMLSLATQLCAVLALQLRLPEAFRFKHLSARKNAAGVANSRAASGSCTLHRCSC